MQNTENFGENPNLLPIISLENIGYVIDSRLVAEGLNIAHKNLMETIKKYQSEIEKSFGAITFETEVLKHETYKGSTQQKFCYLTEDQAIFIGTLSRNTEEVVSFKIKLVQSFSSVRKSMIQAQKTSHYQLLPPEFQRLLIEIDALKESNQNLHKNLQQNTQKFQERLFHIENILDNRPYIPHKTAIPLLKYYVYFAFNPDNNLTKIGRSHEPETRLKTFKAISPNVDMTLVINVVNLKISCQLETFLHSLFAPKHKSGEIFELSDTDFKMLELLKDAIEAFN